MATNMKSLNGYGFDASALGGKSPNDFAPSDHGHKFADITEKPDAYPPATHNHSYNDLKDKPSIPDVPAWAMQADKPSYSADEIGYGDNSNVGDALGSLKSDKLDKTGTAADASKLGGQLPAYFAKASEVAGLQKSIFIHKDSTVISSIGLPNKPTSESNVLYTVPADGLFYLYADRGSVGGYTLFVTIIKPNGDVLMELNFPAYDPYAVICTFIPLSSGMKIKLSTDNSAETWTIRKQQFIY